MSACLLLGLRRWQHLSAIPQRVCLQTKVQSYATKILLPGFVSALQQLPASSNTPIGILHKQHYASKPQVVVKEQPLGINELMQKLEAQYNEYGNLIIEQYENLLTQLEAQNTPSKQLLTPEQTNFLLGACGKIMPAQQTAERLLLFNRLWRYLQKQGQLTVAHYHTQLQVLQHNRAQLTDLSALLREILELDVTATRSAELYAELLLTACCSGNMRQATEVLGEMRTQQLPLTERNFNALLLGHGRNGDLQGCQTVLDSMLAAGLPLSSETQTALAIAYMENGVQPKASDILHRFHRQFEVRQVLRMLRAALYAELDAALLIQLVHELPAEFTSGAEVPRSLKNLCIELLHNGKLPTVVTIISTLPTPVFNENQDVDTFGVFLLRELYRAHVESTKVLEIAQLLKESGKNTRALHLAIEMALHRNPAGALPLLEALAKEESLRPQYFWPLLMYNFRRSGETGILRTLKLMTDLGVACDEQTLRLYVLPRLAILMEDPLQAVKRLDESGLKTSLVLTPILAHLLGQQQLEQALKLVQVYPTKLELNQLLTVLCNTAVNVRATKRYQQYAKLLAALVKKSNAPKTDFIGQLLLQLISTQQRVCSDTSALCRFIKEMQKCGLTVSSAALGAIIKSALPAQTSSSADLQQALQKMHERELVLPNASSVDQNGAPSSSFIKHPRDMSLDELECHLIELEAKGLNARGVLRRLLQMCVRDGRLQRAVEIKAKCDALQVQVSPGMLACVFDMYIKLKDLPNAQHSLQRLQQTYPGFQIDEHKIIDYAALLVHSQQLEEGKQLLQQRAAAQKINGGDYVLKNVWNFLTAVAHLAAAQKPPLPPEQNWTRDTFVFLQQLGYCSTHNAILGPIVREYLLRGDMRSAVTEFSRLAEQYHHTPLQFELLSLLVRLCNAQSANAERFGVAPEQAQQLLSETTTSIVQVHSAVNMNSALLLAFAESGTDNQLRRLLINPEFRINQDLLIKNCEHLGQEGAVQTLLRLGRGARGLSRYIDEQRIYNMLLQNFVASNNYAAALDLFERLEADDELKISQDFLRGLVKLLQLNNLDIPGNIALRAQVM